jgi:hypothetical protein
MPVLRERDTVRDLVTIEAMEERYEAQIREGEAVNEMV